MNYKRTLLSISLLLALGLFSFTPQNRLTKKVKKEIEKTFKTKEYVLEPIVVHDTVASLLYSELKPKSLFKIVGTSGTLGYAFVDQAPSKADVFDYLILLDNNLILVKTKVLVYREDYGGEIGSKRWLKQFIGKNFMSSLNYGNDIIAISGATISAQAMTRAVNHFFKNIKILHQNKIV